MNVQPSPDVLAQALAEEIAGARAFGELLARERRALTDGDLEQVFSLANEKLELATRLRTQADRRESMLIVLGGASGRDNPYAQWPAVNSRWQLLRELLTQAGEANRVNGLIVNARLAAIGGALAALRGTDNDLSLYARDGVSTARSVPSSACWAA